MQSAAQYAHLDPLAALGSLSPGCFPALAPAGRSVVRAAPEKPGDGPVLVPADLQHVKWRNVCARLQRAGEWHRAREGYLKAYLGHSKTWRGRYLLFEGYADLLQGTTEFTAADLETLRRVTKDGSKTLIERVYAHSAHGRLRWTLGEGDEAARAYRKALELAASATLQHRSELVLSHHGRSNPTWVPARELFDFFMQQNKTSLATLIGVGPCGMMSLLKQGDRCYAWPTLGNSAEQATARQAAMSRATIIRSAICAQCGATDKKLFCCSKCKLAYYCSTACQRAGWKVHQPQCRAPGDFCAGDYVMLHGLYDTSGRRHGGNLSEREMNGYFFRVVERDAEEAGVWRVENRILVQRTVSVHVDNMRHVLTH